MGCPLSTMRSSQSHIGDTRDELPNATNRHTSIDLEGQAEQRPNVLPSSGVPTIEHQLRRQVQSNNASSTPTSQAQQTQSADVRPSYAEALKENLERLKNFRPLERTLTAVYQAKKQSGTGVALAHDTDTNYDVILNDALNACLGCSRDISPYANFDPQTNEVFKILHTETSDHPLSEIPAAKRWRLSIDPKRVDDLEKRLKSPAQINSDMEVNPFLAFLFDDEKHYQLNMAKAWKMVTEKIEQPVTCDWIIRLHDCAVGKDTGNSDVLKFDNEKGVSFNITSGNHTQEGRQQIKLKSQLAESRLNSKSGLSHFYLGNTIYSSGSNESYRKEVDHLINQYYSRLKKIDNKPTEELKDALDLEANYFPSSDVDDNTVTEQEKADKRIFAAIDLCQDLEHLHPFPDGNCRTFCVLLLNKLLLQQGQPMTLLDDPNRFDGFSRGELFDMIREGQQWIKDGMPRPHPVSSKCVRINNDHTVYNNEPGPENIQKLENS